MCPCVGCNGLVRHNAHCVCKGDVIESCFRMLIDCVRTQGSDLACLVCAGRFRSFGGRRGELEGVFGACRESVA